MKKFRVYAKMTEWLYVDVDAESKEAAEEIASKIDGGEFSGCQNGLWEIENAEEIDHSKITSKQQVIDFLEDCIDYVGLGFHIDHDFKDYYDLRNGGKCFHPEVAEEYNQKLSQCIDYCDANDIDIYGLALDLL